MKTKPQDKLDKLEAAIRSDINSTIAIFPKAHYAQLKDLQLHIEKRIADYRKSAPEPASESDAYLSLYLITLNDGEVWTVRGYFPGASFALRLAEIQEVYPTAVDWEMCDD